jgi:hypothetical protein
MARAGGDGLFGPVLGGEALDGAPEVDRGHGGAYDVFAHRPHLVVVVGVFDQHVDFAEAGFDGRAEAPGAVGDGQFAVLFGDCRRLEDADRLDARSQRRVGHVAWLDFAGVAGIRLDDAGIDASQFHLNSPDFRSSRTSSKMKPKRARAIRPGQRRRVAPGSGPPSEATERTHPLRRPDVPCLWYCLLPFPAFEAPFL